MAFLAALESHVLCPMSSTHLPPNSYGKGHSADTTWSFCQESHSLKEKKNYNSQNSSEKPQNEEKTMIWWED